MMVTDVKGAFDKVSGTVEIDDKDAAKSQIDVEIDAASINTRNQKRDDHLRGSDFFDVARFAKITFKSTKIEVAKDGSMKITGDVRAIADGMDAKSKEFREGGTALYVAGKTS